MGRFTVISLLTLVAITGLAWSPANAQFGGYQPGIRSNNYRPYQPITPTYSPYLNLLRGGSPLFSNYYGLVRPELDFRRSLQGVQQQANLNSQDIAALDALGIDVTGHKIRFFNTTHYFFNLGGRTSTDLATLAAALATARPRTGAGYAAGAQTSGTSRPGKPR
jgi:hypothetical protein